MSTVRIVLVVAILAAVVAGGVMLTAAPDGSDQTSEAPATAAFTRSEQCRECHPIIYDEWKESWHGQAYTNQDVLDLSNNFQDQQCISCHAPSPVYGIGVGERIFERNEFREDGVDCISCHMRPDGRVVGLRGLEAPCRPVKDESLGTAQFCNGCHNQHYTVDEFMAWKAKTGRTETCNDCHSPKVDRPLAVGGPVREKVATHRFEGGHYLWLLKEAATVETKVEDGRLVVHVTNSGAGHKMPTDSRNKSFNLLVTLYDQQGNVVMEQTEVAEYRMYYRQDHKESTQIEPLETREVVVPLPEGRTGKAVVELVYCLSPPAHMKREWTVVEKREQPF